MGLEETEEERRRRLARERKARWRADNRDWEREKGREAKARWLSKPENREKAYKRTSEWKAENPEKVRSGNREASARRRAEPENREKDREWSRRWKAADRERALFNACRASAKRRGHDCSLTLEDVRSLLRPMKCEATGLALSWGWDGLGPSPWAPSLDRIDCSDGYHLDNVRLVCWAFNQARGAWPDSVVMQMAQALIARE